MAHFLKKKKKKKLVHWYTNVTAPKTLTLDLYRVQLTAFSVRT